jgi:hypothetical protein
MLRYFDSIGDFTAKRAPHHTAFVREVARVCPPKEKSDFSSLVSRAALGAIEKHGHQLEEAETAIVELSKTVEQLADLVKDNSKTSADALSELYTRTGSHTRRLAALEAAKPTAALEAAKPTAPRVPSRIGAPCEVWADGDGDVRRTWYYKGFDANGSLVFVANTGYLGTATSNDVAFDNWRELAPVEDE